MTQSDELKHIKCSSSFLLVSCITLSLITITLFSGVILSSNSASADVVDDVTINVPVSCNMTSELDTAHTATINAGQYQSDIGTTNFKVVCNDNSGYAIYAIGYSNEEYGNTKMLATINNTATPTYDINTGTNTSGANSSWSMKLIPVTTASSGTTQPYTPTIESDTNGSFANYHIVPSVYTKVATFASNTDFTIGSSLQSTYQVYIDGTKPAGTYAGKVKYTLVHPSTEVPLQPQTTNPGKICYYPNGSNVVGTMGCQTIPSSGTTDGVSPTSATLLASNFSREGYGFAGWSTTFDYSDSTGFYGPQETISFAASQYTGANPGLSLYAHWVKSAGDLQGWTGCPNLASGAVTALTDQRDNDTYAVAKLADGNCWTIENLRLESTAAHNSDGTLAQGYGTSSTYGNFSGLADAESTGFSETYSANTLYSNDGSNNTINIGTSNFSAYRMPRYNNANTSARASSPTSSVNVAMYSYGNYYTWPAAIADTTAHTSNNQSVTSTSICPVGWHLPKGGNKSNEANNEFWSLTVTGINNGTNPADYDSNVYPSYMDSPEGTDASDAIRAYPNNFVYSGNIGGNSVGDRGSGGYYWSSTAYSINYAYHLYLSSSRLIPGTNYHYKNVGQAIRCVAPGA